MNSRNPKHSLQHPEHVPVTYDTIVFIDIDGDGKDPRFAAEVTVGESTGGEVLARFDRAVAEQVVAWTNQLAEHDEEGPVAEWDGDAVLVFTPDSPTDPIVYEADEDGRYAIGAGVWAWEVESDESDTESESSWQQDFIWYDGSPAWTYFTDDEDGHYAHIHGDGPFVWLVGEAGPGGRQLATGTVDDFHTAQQQAQESYAHAVAHQFEEVSGR